MNTCVRFVVWGFLGEHRSPPARVTPGQSFSLERFDFASRLCADPKCCNLRITCNPSNMTSCPRLEFAQFAPPKDLVFFPPLHTKPQDGVGDYMASKLFREIPRDNPPWDCARQGPLMDMMLAKRELEKAKADLAAKREYQKGKREQMDQQWEELKNREERLSESFAMYNKFVKENYEKRERAIEKIAEEEKNQEVRRAEIVDLKGKADELNRIKEAMEKHANKLKIYQDFLERVVGECPEFNTVHEIIDRYENLKKTRTELATRQDNDLQSLENARKELMLILEEKSKALMGYTNQLADLWIRYDKVRMEDLQWEAFIIRMQDKVQQKIREYGASRLLVWRMYKLICQIRLEQPTLTPEQIEEQLLFIQHNFLQLQSIARIARRNTAAAEAAKVPPQQRTHHEPFHSKTLRTVLTTGT